jgi:hypothetical protein
MYVQRDAVACSLNNCCHENATMGSLGTVVHLHVAVNSKIVECCHENAIMLALCIVVELQNIPYCKQYKRNFYCCTEHSEIHIVHSPTNALFIKLGNV